MCRMSRLMTALCLPNVDPTTKRNLLGRAKHCPRYSVTGQISALTSVCKSVPEAQCDKANQCLRHSVTLHPKQGVP